MASEHQQQVALARTHRMPTPSSHISKAARQVVPAFLQKLYEMVNDNNNAELIRWSDAGDSFFVLDHERFAHEVLGRWFKHRNFASFVRQLNMYGFHKIPHLQQGVLKSDNDAEFWNFAHSNFLRGQPDLLCLIQRKKQIPQSGEDISIDLRDPNTGVIGSNGNVASVNGAPGTATLASGQVLDLSTVMTGLTAIKRHQTTLSAELNELKRSNQLLWQESLSARAKHQKQQDTINRIVKFLAGVFGHHGVGGSAGGVAGGSGSVSGGKDEGENTFDMTPGVKRRMTLMIEDAKRDGPTKSMIEELTELPMDSDEAVYDSTYPTIETPGSIPSPPPPVALSDAGSIVDVPSYLKNTQSSNPKVEFTPSTKSNSSSSSAAQSTEPQWTSQEQQGAEIPRAVTPSRLTPSFEFDPRMQGVINQLSPLQIQQLLASLASQTTITNPQATINPADTSSNNAIAPYIQPSSYDFSLNPATQFPAFVPTDNPSLPSDGLIPFDPYEPHQDHDMNLDVDIKQSSGPQPDKEKLQRQWQVAADIDKDVSALNANINSLIQTFGLDPALLEDNATMRMLSGTGEPGGEAVGTGDIRGETSRAISSDFDFDTFFNNFPSGSGTNDISTNDDSTHGTDIDYNELVSTAFLDEVPTPASSDMTVPPIGPNTAGRKRKSDIDFDGKGPLDGMKATAATGASGKSKRRKDK